MRGSSKRKTIYLAPPVEAVVKRIADQRHMTANDVIRMAIGYLDVIERARIDGVYVGTTTQREQLDTIMVPPL
jgi:hypothetical protein